MTHSEHADACAIVQAGRDKRATAYWVRYWNADPSTRPTYDEAKKIWRDKMRREAGLEC